MDYVRPVSKGKPNPRYTVQTFTDLKKAAENNYACFHYELLQERVGEMLVMLHYGYMYIIVFRHVIRNTSLAKKMLEAWVSIDLDSISIDRNVLIGVLENPNTVPKLTKQNAITLQKHIMNGNFENMLLNMQEDNARELSFCKPKRMRFTHVLGNLFFIKRFEIEWHNSGGPYDIVEIQRRISLGSHRAEIEAILFDRNIWKRHHFTNTQSVRDILSTIITGYDYCGKAGYVRRNKFAMLEDDPYAESVQSGTRRVFSRSTPHFEENVQKSHQRQHNGDSLSKVKASVQTHDQIYDEETKENRVGLGKP